MARRDLLVAAGILRDRFGRVLLVGNDWQGHGRVRHTLPGGVVEPGERCPRRCTARSSRRRGSS